MMRTDLPPTADLVWTRDALHDGRLRACDLLDTLLRRADRLDPTLGSFLARFDAEARAQADRHDRARAAGEALPPLSGVPLGIKAMLSTRERAADAQSLVLDPDRLVGADADAVAALRAAGAVIVGHTVSVEHAMGRPDPAMPGPIPRNPWALDRWPGGSSSGTANGIAAGLFLGGLGTDTTGSARIPAAFCGITGFKPSFGLVPAGGSLPAAPSMDVVGPMAISARDIRLLMSVLVPGGAARASAAPGIIGVPEELLTETRGVTSHTRAAFSRSLGLLETQGYRVQPVALPEFDELVAVTLCLSIAEVSALHRDRLTEQWDRYGRSFRRIAAVGGALTPESVAAARQRREDLRELVGERLRGLSALATPTWPTGAAPYAASGGVPVPETNFTAAWSAVGFPSLSVPAGLDPEGMPLGLLLTGAPGQDAAVIAVGEALQAVDQQHLSRPAIDLAALPEPAPVPDPDGGGEPGLLVPPEEQPAWLGQLGNTLSAREHAVITGMGAAIAGEFARVFGTDGG